MVLNGMELNHETHKHTIPLLRVQTATDRVAGLDPHTHPIAVGVE